MVDALHSLGHWDENQFSQGVISGRTSAQTDSRNGSLSNSEKSKICMGVIPWSYNAESFEYFHLNDRQSDDPQTTRGGCLFNYCQPLMCNDTELHRSTSIGPRLPTGMHSMQLPCCMQCTIHITWLYTAWQVCKGSAVLLLVLALHLNTSNGTQAVQNESSLCRARQPQDLHILWQSVWDAVPSLV